MEGLKFHNLQPDCQTSRKVNEVKTIWKMEIPHLISLKARWLGMTCWSRYTYESEAIHLPFTTIKQTNCHSEKLSRSPECIQG